MAFRTIVEKNAGGREVVKLLDTASGASASVLPSYGFNLFDLRLPVAGRVTPVIVSAPGWDEAPKDPGRNGTPILFPYPNRIRSGKYSFGGKDYQLPITLGPNAIHGFAFDAKWSLVEHGGDAAGAFVVGRFHLASHAPEMRPLWPTDAMIQVRYSLAGRTLSMSTTVSNPTERDLPYGFGIHPYFRLPFGPGGDAAKTAVILPASKTWVLDAFLPTGEIRPVDQGLDFREGKPRLGLKLDDVFTGLSYRGDRGMARLVDREKGAELRLIFDKSFRELVAYTPDDPDVISIEPYTQTTDAINLQPKGVDAGLRVLGHGQSETLELAIETSEVSG